MRMKRSAKVAVVAIAAVVVVGALAVWRLGDIVEAAVNRAGPALLGVPVRVDDVDVGLLQGRFRIKGFVLGNPPGFSTPSALEVGELSVRLAPASLLGGTVRVREVMVRAPRVTYEQTLHGSNIGAIERAMGGAEKEPSEKPARPESPAREKKRVVIDRVVVEEGRITLKMGVGATIPLPRIEIRDIGKEEPSGTTLLGATRRVLGAVLAAVTRAVSGTGHLAVEGVREIGSSVAHGVGVAGEAAAGVGQAVGRAGGDVVRGIGRLIGGDRKDEKK